MCLQLPTSFGNIIVRFAIGRETGNGWGRMVAQRLRRFSRKGGREARSMWMDPLLFSTMLIWRLCAETSLDGVRGL